MKVVNLKNLEFTNFTWDLLVCYFILFCALNLCICPYRLFRFNIMVYRWTKGFRSDLDLSYKIKTWRIWVLLVMIFILIYDVFGCILSPWTSFYKVYRLVGMLDGVLKGVGVRWVSKCLEEKCSYWEDFWFGHPGHRLAVPVALEFAGPKRSQRPGHHLAMPVALESAI